MSNNNTPTAPGWYYRDETSTEDQMVYVAGVSDGKAFYIQVNRDGLLSDSAESPKWRGPVPMPGAIEALNDALTEAEAIMGGEYGDHYGPFADMVERARELAGVL